MPSAAQQSKSQKVKCKQIEKTLEGSDDPIILRKCTYQNYIFKSKGRADQKGRYSYEYSVFETREKDTIEISNSRFFKNVDNLESILNDRLSKMYQSDQKIRELAMCME